MNGAFSEIVVDGIMYRIIECDNIELFADHKLYLCVNDNGPFYRSEAYNYDESTGLLTRNEAYQGVNALFELPIDASKADPAAAKAYIDSLGME